MAVPVTRETGTDYGTICSPGNTQHGSLLNITYGVLQASPTSVLVRRIPG